MKSVDEIDLSERDREAVKAASAMLRARFPVERVVLFGSKARGDDDSESDVDLLLLTSRELSWSEQEEISDALFDIGLSHGVVISTLDVPAREWTDGIYQVLPIHDEIERDGVAA